MTTNQSDFVLIDATKLCISVIVLAIHGKESVEEFTNTSKYWHLNVKILTIMLQRDGIK
jgi:hypothetical protein